MKRFVERIFFILVYLWRGNSEYENKLSGPHPSHVWHILVFEYLIFKGKKYSAVEPQTKECKTNDKGLQLCNW